MIWTFSTQDFDSKPLVTNISTFGSNTLITMSRQKNGEWKLHLSRYTLNDIKERIVDKNYNNNNNNNKFLPER